VNRYSLILFLICIFSISSCRIGPSILRDDITAEYIYENDLHFRFYYQDLNYESTSFTKYIELGSNEIKKNYSYRVYVTAEKAAGISELLNKIKDQTILREYGKDSQMIDIETILHDRLTRMDIYLKHRVIYSACWYEHSSDGRYVAWINGEYYLFDDNNFMLPLISYIFYPEKDLFREIETLNRAGDIK
jgi:hypothetical protein